MPRRIITRGGPDAVSPQLLDKLAAELAGKKNRFQPVIVEEIIPGTGSRHVHVIWDEWKGIPDEQRSRAIIDAYRKIEGDDASNISIAIGAMPQEAFELGLMPFSIQGVRRRTDSLRSEDYEKAIEKELPRTLLGKESRQLRYATLEDAEEARRRLEQSLPGSYWSVLQELGPIERWLSAE